MVRVRANFLLVCSRIFHSLKFDMQHDDILKKNLIFTRSEVNAKVKVIQKWYMTLHHLKMHPHANFGIPISINIGNMF